MKFSVLALLLPSFFFFSSYAGGQNLIGKDSVDRYLSQAREVIYDDLQASLPFLKKADELAKASEDLDLQAEVDHLYAVLYYVKGDYELSLKYYTSASEKFRNTGNKTGIAKCLVGEGLIQQGIDRHPEAIRLFGMAIKAYKDAGRLADANPAYFNIAISEIETGNLEPAKSHLQKAITLSRQAKRTGVEHMALNRLAEIAFLKGEFEKSAELYHQVLEHPERANGWEKSYSHAGLARLHQAQKNYDPALQHALLAYDFSKTTGSFFDLERNTSILYDLYKHLHNPELALKFLEENRQYRDSLYDQKKLREINLLQLGNREAENRRLRETGDQAQRELFYVRSLTAGMVVLAGVLFFLVFVYRRNILERINFNLELEEKNKTISSQNKVMIERNSRLTELNSTKDRLFSILSHDLRSPVGSIQQLLEMIKSGEFSEEERTNLLDEMLLQVSGTSLMLHNLLHWANSQMEGYNSNLEKVFLPHVVQNVLMAHHSAIRTKNIQLNHDIPDDLSTIIADGGQLSIVLHNLITNAVKFTREGNRISISYEEQEERLLVRILDGGMGISHEKIEEIRSFDGRLTSEIGTKMETGTGLGLLLVKQFLPLNNAVLEINSYPGEGAEFIIAFSKDNLK